MVVLKRLNHLQMTVEKIEDMASIVVTIGEEIVASTDTSDGTTEASNGEMVAGMALTVEIIMTAEMIVEVEDMNAGIITIVETIMTAEEAETDTSVEIADLHLLGITVRYLLKMSLFMCDDKITAQSLSFRVSIKGFEYVMP